MSGVRDEFEEWFLSVSHEPYGWLDHNGLERTIADGYSDSYVQGCWVGWQARGEGENTAASSFTPVEADKADKLRIYTITEPLKPQEADSPEPRITHLECKVEIKSE